MDEKMGYLPSEPDARQIIGQAPLVFVTEQLGKIAQAHGIPVEQDSIGVDTIIGPISIGAIDTNTDTVTLSYDSRFKTYVHMTKEPKLATNNCSVVVTQKNGVMLFFPYRYDYFIRSSGNNELKTEFTWKYASTGQVTPPHGRESSKTEAVKNMFAELEADKVLMGQLAALHSSETIQTFVDAINLLEGVKPTTDPMTLEQNLAALKGHNDGIPSALRAMVLKLCQLFDFDYPTWEKEYVRQQVMKGRRNIFPEDQ